MSRGGIEKKNQSRKWFKEKKKKLKEWGPNLKTT
jgi:hypothetical protein